MNRLIGQTSVLVLYVLLQAYYVESISTKRLSSRSARLSHSSLRQLNESWSEKYLYQSHFDSGTVLLDQPGRYVLGENITFCPNASSLEQERYDRNAFAMGFFAAIAVTGTNIEIDLNGNALQQCESHILMQRFFSMIELALQPFTSGNGPHDFVGNSTFQAARNVIIQGPGIIRRSSHHGIHGNENKNILIKNIFFEDFEIAAIHLNNVDGLVIEDCVINGNRRDVPVLGTFSAAIFIRPYIQLLRDYQYTTTLRNIEVTASDVFDQLTSSIHNVYNDVIETGFISATRHPREYVLFSNAGRVAEGSCYGILVYGHGPASNGFAITVDAEAVDDTSSRIYIRRNVVRNLRCMTKDVPAAVEHGNVLNDVRGAVFQFYDTFTGEGLSMNMADGTYQGNVLSDAQIMVAAAIADGTLGKIGKSNNPSYLTNLNTIPIEVIEWARGIPTGSPPKPPKYEPKYRCLGDAMHHVIKGMVGIRLEETIGFVIEDNIIDDIINLTPCQFAPRLGCTDYHTEVDEENGNKRQAANVRGISVSAARSFSDATKSVVSNNTVTHLFSDNAFEVIGISVQGDAQGFDLLQNTVDLGVPDDLVSDVYKSLVVGPNAGPNSTIFIDNNILKQKSYILNTENGTSLNPPLAINNQPELDRERRCPFSNF